MQAADAPEVTLVGLQDRAETKRGATRLTVAVCKAPFKAAVTVAVWLVVKTPAVAMKEAELAPADTFTDAGTVSSGLLSESVTVAPEEAGWLKLTVQEVKAPEATVAGLQLSDVKVGSPPIVIVPPVAVVGIALAEAEAPSALVTPMVVPDEVGDNVTVSNATTPFWIRFPFSPVIRQR